MSKRLVTYINALKVLSISEKQAGPVLMIFLVEIKRLRVREVKIC